MSCGGGVWVAMAVGVDIVLSVSSFSWLMSSIVGGSGRAGLGSVLLTPSECPLMRNGAERADRDM